MNRTAVGALAICSAAALWGLDGVVLTPRLGNLPVLLVVLLLHAVPFLLMIPFLSSSLRRIWAMDGGGWLALVAVSATGGVLGTFAIVKALFLVNFNQLSVVVLLQKLQPVFAIGLAALLLGERVNGAFLRWTALALGGAYLLTFGVSVPHWGGSKVGAAAVWAVVAAAAFGSATVLGKRLLHSLDFRSATFARYGMTAVLALAAVLAADHGLPLAQVTAPNWLLILVIGLTTGSGAIFLYYWGLTRVSASVATICELCLPLSAVLLDYLINGSVLGGWQWLGAALLIGSIVQITRGAGTTPVPPARPLLEAQLPHREHAQGDRETDQDRQRHRHG
jgi:drug/metabolite transporter (DMT)-like permease